METNPCMVLVFCLFVFFFPVHVLPITIPLCHALHMLCLLLFLKINFSSDNTFHTYFSYYQIIIMMMMMFIWFLNVQLMGLSDKNSFEDLNFFFVLNALCIIKACSGPLLCHFGKKILPLAEISPSSMIFMVSADTL